MNVDDVFDVMVNDLSVYCVEVYSDFNFVCWYKFMWLNIVFDFGGYFMMIEGIENVGKDDLFVVVMFFCGEVIDVV